MNLLIIGNPGAFSESIISCLSLNYTTYFHYIDKSLTVASNIMKIKNFIIKKIKNLTF